MPLLKNGDGPQIIERANVARHDASRIELSAVKRASIERMDNKTLEPLQRKFRDFLGGKILRPLEFAEIARLGCIAATPAIQGIEYVPD